jgi:2-dehydropantoate 2-reductase
MRIVVMGAGGVGGFFGAKLALAGNDVTFIARGRHLAALRERGLVVTSASGDLRLARASAAARMAKAAGITAPVNATLYAALKPYCDGAPR